MKPVAPAAPAAAPDAARAKLRAAAHQLEGVFIRQLFEAMRRATPQEGLGGKSEGQELFTTMLDDALADQAAAKLERGLGEALYRQLSRRLGPAPEQP